MLATSAHNGQCRGAAATVGQRRRTFFRCQVCQHTERVRIELLIASGASTRAVARKFKCQYDATWRHWRHVPDERKAALALGPVQRTALAARVCEESESVLDNLKVVLRGLYQLFDASIEAGDRNAGAAVAGRLVETCRAIGKITGELAATPLVSSQTNIFVLPQFAEIQAALIHVLARHPAARADVIKAFRDLEARTTPPVMIETRRETQTAA